MRRAVLLLVFLVLAAGVPSCDWLNLNDCPPLTGSMVPSGDGAGGGGGDDGAGGSDVGVGAGGSDVGVGVGVGAGAGSADVGAGAGPGGRAPPRRSRPVRWRWHYKEPIGTAVEAICTPNLRLFTTTRLRQVAAANNIGVGLTGIQQSREIGLWFQTWVLYTINLPENMELILSPRRQAANMKNGGLPASVIPDPVQPLYLTGAEDAMGAVTFPESQFLEVKAVTGNMTLSTSRYQILGLVDVASRSSAGTSTVPMHPPPQLIFLTTGNTTIGDDVKAQATALGVALWQAPVFEDLNTNPNNPMLYLNAFEPLNAQVYAPAVPVVSQVAWPVSPLTAPPTQLTVVPGDPDPPEVD
jgi:hypothetical protein